MFSKIATRALVLFSGFLLIASTQAKATLDPSRFAASDQFGQARLSPDGRHIAIERKDELSSTLLIIDAQTLAVTAEMRFRTNESVHGAQWANNDTLLISRAIRMGGLETPRSTGEIYALSPDGKRREYLYGYRASGSKRNRGRNNDNGYASVIDALTNDDDHVLLLVNEWEKSGDLHNKPAVIRINVRTGAREEITRVPIARPSVIADAAGQVRFAWGYDENIKPTTFRFESRTGTWQQLPPQPGDLGAVMPLQFLPDNHHYLALVSNNGEADCLYLFDDQSDERQQLVCEGEFDVGGLMPSSIPGMPLAAITTVAIPTVRLLGGSDADKALYSTLSKAFAPSLLRFLDFSSDGSKILFEVDSDRDPGRVYLHDINTNHSKLVFARRPSIESSQMATSRAIHLQARDGVNLHGFLTLPNNNSGNSASLPPLVVMPHGGPIGVRDSWFFDADAQWLATNGYAVLQINFRGSGGFGLGFERLGFQQWGGAIQDDIIDATQWAIEQKLVDGQRVCIAGGSFGAYSALMSAIKAPELFKCAVGYAGVYDLASMYKRGDIPDTEQGRRYLELVIGKDDEALVANSPLRQIDKLQAATLLVHGDADWRTPIAHARELRAALERAGKSVEWLEVSGEGHGFFRKKHRELYMRRLINFLDQHIGAAAPAVTPAK